MESIRKAIECGVRKVNYFSKAGTKEIKDYVSNNNDISFATMTNIMVNAIKKDIEDAMSIVSMK